MKCVAPIQALSVPKGCSTVARRMALTPAQLEAGERIFAEWMSENWGEIHRDGGLGDVCGLLSKLKAAFQ